MERIEILIKKLNDQFLQGADSETLLSTVRLMEFELTKQSGGTMHSWGTAKVAVMLPLTNTMVVSNESDSIYNPSAASTSLPISDVPKSSNLTDSTSNTLEKEVFVLEEEELAVPSIPEWSNRSEQPLRDTTSSQPTSTKEINDLQEQVQNSLNDKLKQHQTELAEVLNEQPVKDLRKAIGINDRFLFIHELFHGDENMYERCIKTINHFTIYPETEYWINTELKKKLGWDDANETVQHFEQLVRRRFS
ncbi:MAG: hypothetical protein RL115_2533 [Bacteroidota bacterium]|jgi:hypothetical protein